MKKFAVTLAALSASFAVHAENNWTNALDYTTLGIWADAPLGVSARVGLAIPIHDKETAVTIGDEIGLHGNKQFVGYRIIAKGHGIAWGGVELARWKTRSHPWLADERTEYYGVEAQLLVVRAGLMFPKGDGHHPKLALGAGFGF
ncbi:hypothetical protein GM658_09460 [Pseudoduganella eburnea]|uniref:Uncharacterized protein n=1 Tax=Massilia eburnea TaxID=1776165 RepID=A0A6L6QF99_9BURK|nr:hypothetical protein [Massilia eburnea]MTW10831.1 hypothetical protein [Massilia eburnea]